MHRASLRTKRVQTYYCPPSRAEPTFSTKQAIPAPQALFCQSGIKWTGEKQGIAFERNGQMMTEAACGSKEKLEW